MDDLFRSLARWTADVVGRAHAFLIAVLVIVVWAITGPVFEFSDTWQLIINTGTTIITFLMVFLIQNTQNRESKAMHVKLDEIIRSTRNAKNSLMDAEEMTDEQLDELMEKFKKLSQVHEARKQRRISESTTQ
ncbi:MAG: low affinity iron permease family protein [Patescibacteria group bacterium]|nr:low affinity iron permease family protein [Patescibacteria group bacterium]